MRQMEGEERENSAICRFPRPRPRLLFEGGLVASERERDRESNTALTLSMCEACFWLHARCVCRHSRGAGQGALYNGCTYLLLVW